jgi:hypothetical protein
MPCSFGPLPHPRSEACTQPTGLLEVTVVDRWIPLVTAAYGTQVARPARTTMAPPGGNGSQSGWRVRPILGDHRLVGKSRRARGSQVGILELRPASWKVAWLGFGRWPDLRFLVTGRDRSCPLQFPICRRYVYPSCTGRLRASGRDALALWSFATMDSSCHGHGVIGCFRQGTR